jgi:flagellar assembly factor FliW
MKCAETTVAERPAGTETVQPDTNKGVIHFPAGLLGFEDVKNYVLLGSPEEAPFLWLQMVDDPNMAFLVISPSVVTEDYQPDINPEDVAFLGLENPQDALVFNIVTMHKDGSATVNLKGPIVVNRRTLIGKQVIPQNSTSFPLQLPLPLAA